MSRVSIKSFAVGIACALSIFWAAPQAGAADVYVQTNLVSNISGLAQSTDANLRNPWGLSFSATSPFWSANAGSNTSTLYQGTGSTVNARVVGVAGGPTGTVIGPGTGFVEANGRSASFLFSTLSGGIYAWNASDTNAQQVASVAGTSFTGLAIANNGSGDFLYASNSAGFGSIEVFDSKFARVSPSGSFTDPNLGYCHPLFCSAPYVPFNIQNLNGLLYVEYANFKLATGAVSVFDANGNFIKTLIPPGEPHLRAPWGIVIAPAGFGSLAGSVLVGNFGNGQINAFDPITGAFRSTLSNVDGPIVNSGLWALSVRTGGTFDTSAVYFAAGINDQRDGLFGKLTLATASTVLITNASQVSTAQVGVPYTRTLVATGGVAPYSNWRVTTGSLPAGLALNADTGVLSGTALAVNGTFSFMISVNDSRGTTGSASFQMTVQPSAAPAGLSRIGSFAQVAFGGGWKTSMTLSNPSAFPISAKINFYADNGSPMTLPLTVAQFGWNTTGESISLTLSPNETIVMESAASTTSIGVGWADVLATGNLAGSSTLAAGSATALNTQAPLDSRLSTALLLNFDNTNGFQMAVAIANQSANPNTITAILLDSNGVQLATAPISLSAFGHSAFFLSNLLPQAANKAGSIRFESSAGVAGVGLRFSSTGTFTLVPTIR